MYVPGTCTNGTAPRRGIGTSAGLGCVECGGGCGMSGLSMDGSGLFGTGVFGTGVALADFSTWTWAEFAALSVGAYLLYSVAFTTRHTSQRVRTKASRIKKAVVS